MANAYIYTCIYGHFKMKCSWKKKKQEILNSTLLALLLKDLKGFVTFLLQSIWLYNYEYIVLLNGNPDKTLYTSNRLD